MVHRYKTISSPTESLSKEKSSKFIGIAVPVISEEEVQLTLAAARKKYNDCTHICYAYVLGADKSKWRANDDGEPSGSAGKPILGQITAFDLTNVLVMVVRYYGGTKLGVGGLVQAYKQAAANALLLTTIIEKHVVSAHTVICTYEQMGHILKEIKKAGGNILQNEQQEICTIVTEIPLINQTTFITAIKQHCINIIS